MMKVIQLDEESIYHVARRIGDLEAREAYLEQVCGDDEARRDRLDALLRVCEQEASFLESPVFGPPARLAVGGTAHPHERPGAAIGPYKLLEAIGEGGMGTVYMAEQTHPVRRKVALKVIKPGMDTRQVIARFEAERQALALMDHPNIARVLDAGTTESGRPYFVMELVRGTPITDYCDVEKLSVPERLDLFVLVCRAVQHAHQKGVIHRDIKPSNILITLHDGVPIPKVIDFGIAKATGQSLTDRTLYTGFAQLLGTPLYMSPEQAEMSGLDVDTRSDIYSLGVLLYELLTGTTPFDEGTLRKAALDEMRRIIREEEPPKPSTRLSSLGGTLTTVSANRKLDPRQLGRTVGGELDWIVMRALEKDRKRRYETASDFASDVMRYLTDQPVEACPPSARYRFTKFARRNRTALTTALLVCGALLLGVAGSVAMAIRATHAERGTAAALSRARDSLKEADRQRERARKAVDEMYTQVATRWLAREGGLTPLQREFLEKALAFYEEFARERVDDPEARADAAKAAARVGEIRSQLGQAAEAMQSHGRALEEFRRLAAEFPDRPDYRREVARNLQDLAALHAALGRTRDAEPLHREALALREALARATGTPDDRADLAAGLQALGGFLNLTSRPADSEKAMIRARDLLVRLCVEFPGKAHYRGQLAATEQGLGQLYTWTDRKPEAEVALRHCLELRRNLADADPVDPERQFDLAKAYFALGDWWRLTYRYKDAVEELHRALPIAEKLAADHRDRPRYRSSLVSTLIYLAEVLERSGRTEEAERVLNRGREVGEKLATDFPDLPDYRRRVAGVLVNLGVLHAKQGRDREAREVFERGYAISKKLAADHPEVEPYRQNVAAHGYSMAVNYATLNSRDGRDNTRAREVARESVELKPMEAGFWKGLALAEYRVGDLDAALKAEAKTLELRKGKSYDYDFLLLALIHLGRGDRERARIWAITLFYGRALGGGDYTTAADYRRLLRENEPRLRELLPADPGGRLELLRLAKASHSAECGASSEPALRALDGMADQLAGLGRYAEAAAHFEESRRLRPDRWEGAEPFGPWLPLGVLKLRLGDIDGYRAVCAEAMRKNRISVSSIGPELQLSRLCTASAASGVGPVGLAERARRSPQLYPEDPFYWLTIGAAEYRAGRNEAAVEMLQWAIQLPPRDSRPVKLCRAQASTFLAMALHRLGRDEEGRQRLAEADRELAAAPPAPDASAPPAEWHWRELELARVLRREAGEVLGVPPPGRAR